MTLVWSALGAFHEFLDNYGDPRMKTYPLMDTPWPTLAIVATYVFGVKYLGPKIMENRKPFELKKTLIVYNIIEITMSIISLNEAYNAGWFTHYSWQCQPVDYSDTPNIRRLLTGIWLFYLSKYVEFFDTIFFVMRKKNQQISKLHVYHHSVMPINTWVTAKFVPGGHATFGGVINSFVHVIMYTYYLLAALGPGMQKYLWWKKYLTVLQMGQFVVIFLHSLQPLFVDCGFPRPFAYFLISQALVFLVLFKNFYDNAYDNGKPTYRHNGNSDTLTSLVKLIQIASQMTTKKHAEAVTSDSRPDDSDGSSMPGKLHQNNAMPRRRQTAVKDEASR